MGAGLLGIEELDRGQIQTLLDRGRYYKPMQAVA
jgi:hypothetical protein